MQNPTHKFNFPDIVYRRIATNWGCPSGGNGTKAIHVVHKISNFDREFVIGTVPRVKYNERYGEINNIMCW